MEPNDDEEEVEKQYVFGIEVSDLPEGIQPLEVLILVKGINMEDGSPTMTVIGSDGITPWEAVGMMHVEMERMKVMTVYATLVHEAEEEEEEEEYEEDE